MMGDKGEALVTSALAVLLERAGGEITYTQSEYAAIRASHGEYSIQGEVDRTQAGEPIIHVKIVPSTSKGSMAVS